MLKINKNESAARLIKSSAKQIIFYKVKQARYNEIAKATKAQIAGNANADKQITSEFIEMRGTYPVTLFKGLPSETQVNLHYTFDEIKPKKNKTIFIEHKHIDHENNLEDWYIQYSIIQVALYQAMAIDTKDFYTAKFLRKTHKTKHIEVTNERIFELIFSNDTFNRTYIVNITDPKKIIDFYKKKLVFTHLDGTTKELVARRYSKAEIFDKNYKRREWEILSPFIKYKQKERIKQNEITELQRLV